MENSVMNKRCGVKIDVIVRTKLSGLVALNSRNYLSVISRLLVSISTTLCKKSSNEIQLSQNLRQLLVGADKYGGFLDSEVS